MASNGSRGDARALARELTDRLAALATPPPSRTAPDAAGAAAAGAAGTAFSSAPLSLAGSRAMVENAARFVTPVLPADARLFAAKKLLLRSLRIVTRDQTVFNSAVAEALRTALQDIEAGINGALATGAEARGTVSALRDETQAAERRLHEAERRFEDWVARSLLEEGAREKLRDALADADARIGAVAAELAGALTREAAAREALERDRDARAESLARRQEREDESRARFEAQLAELREEVRQIRLEGTLARHAAAAPSSAVRAVDPARPVQPLDPGDPLRASVYFDFERRFRGSEDEIRQRQRADADRFHGVPGPVVDLGCGRGEFVELLAEAGVSALGCDANPLMVARAREKGLAVSQADLFDFLRARADGSLGGITAFQVVEHLPPALLYELVDLAAAKLAPGGRVLFETINPESVYAMRWFWMDLTHVRPVPAPSLEQLLLANGFRDVSVDWRSPVPEEESGGAAEDPRTAAIRRLLFAPQDYAVTGVK